MLIRTLPFLGILERHSIFIRVACSTVDITIAVPGCTVYMDMVHDGWTWLYLAVPNLTWLYLDVHCTWLYLDVHCTWLYIAVPDCTWLYLAVPVNGCTWLNLDVRTRFYLGLPWSVADHHKMVCLCLLLPVFVWFRMIKKLFINYLEWFW